MAIRDHGLPPSVMGLMSVTNGALIVALQPFAASFLTRYPRVPVYATASLVIALGVALTGAATTAWEYALTVTLWSTGEIAVGGIAGAIIADLAPTEARGRYQGAYSWSWGVARFAALTAGSTIYTLISPAALWWTVLALGIAGATTTAALNGAIETRAAAARDIR